jgi:C4-type Zn-finger protein
VIHPANGGPCAFKGGPKYTSDNDLICPVCGQRMRLATVLERAPGERTLVLQCRPCGLSTTKTVEAAVCSDSAHRAS